MKSLYALMTSAIILAAVLDYLAPLVTANQGLASIAETEEDALAELFNAPERWRVILSMDGDKGIEDMNPGGWVESRIVAYVQAPKGMEIKKGHNLAYENTRGTPPFFTRLHWTIRKLRGLTLSATDIDKTGLRYRGWDWLRYDGQAACRTAKASFDLCFAHDDPETDPDGTAPIVLPSPFRIIGAGIDYYTVALSGAAHGRVPRYLPVEGDPNGNATGYDITGNGEDYYSVALDGVPHGRIPLYLNA